MRIVASWGKRWLLATILIPLICLSLGQPVNADESVTLYFEQLRHRNLFSLAESYAMGRLSQTNLPRSRRIQLVIELSKTLSRHAEYGSEQQQHELWAQAKSIVEDARTSDPNSPYNVVLAGQSALVPADEADWLRYEFELQPYDEALSDRIKRQCTAAIEQLGVIENLLLKPEKNATNKNTPGQAPSSFELRVLLHQVRLALARTLRTRAELSPTGSHERTVDLGDAETTARKLTGNADEPIQTRAKLLLADCARLKGEFENGEKMLAAIEKAVPTPDLGLTEEIAALRVRYYLDRRQPPNALELILQVRTKQKRLSGELWFLRTRVLASMRDIAVAQKDKELASKLASEAEITLQRCDDQVGGFWSRRCRQLWEATQAAEKVGPELDRLMMQARADFLANRIEPALNGYARAERSARAAGQTELAFELGYTRASILMREKRHDSGASEFLRLSDEYPEDRRAAAAHLNGAYCLGRLYDEQKTKARCESYLSVLDKHLERFPNDPTADDARYFMGQLEEQRLQAHIALPLYLNVNAKHTRSLDARAGAARCYETTLNQMKEKKLPFVELQRTAMETLEKFLSDQDGTPVWNAAQCEVALHLSAIMLTAEPPQFERAEKLLKRTIESTSHATINEEIERWKRLRQRSDALQVIALAGNGRPDEAGHMIDSLASASPKDVIAIIERLATLIETSNRQRQIQYISLLLRAAEQLGQGVEKLSSEDRNLFDRSLAKAYVASGQFSKALDIFRRQAEAAAKDAVRQREIAQIVAINDQADFVSLARECWRRVEKLTKPGTSEWLTARLGVISTTCRLNELENAKKLIAVTKVLYPELGGTELKERFVTVEKELESRSTRPKGDR